MTMTRKQILTLILAATMLAFCLINLAHAQTVNKSVTVSWTNPTTNTDGTALGTTGPTALAKIQVFLAAAPIADGSTMTPTAEVTPTTTTATRTITAGIGGKVHVRLKACNTAGLCSDFSAASSVDVPVPKPGMPTSVTITIGVE